MFGTRTGLRCILGTLLLMKKFLVIAFAISSLLRPSLVLCMEPTGDVRVEYQESLCCDAESGVSTPRLDDAPRNDCDGCLDVVISTHSIATKRVVDVATMPAIVHGNAWSSALDRDDSVASASNTPFPTLSRSHISTVIIRC